VATAAANVTSFRQQIEIARAGFVLATQSYRMNAQRIREGEGLPNELLQSIVALSVARNEFTHAAAEFNRSQYRLLLAVGLPAEANSRSQSADGQLAESPTVPLLFSPRQAAAEGELLSPRNPAGL